MNFDFKSLSSRKKIVIVLAVLTGTLHFIYGAIGLYGEPQFMNFIFMANLVGNLFFITLLYFTPELNEYQDYIRWGFILFTLSSIVSYFVVYADLGLRALLLPAGIFDKLMEVALIAFLLLDRPLEDHQHERASSATTS